MRNIRQYSTWHWSLPFCGYTSYPASPREWANPTDDEWKRWRFTGVEAPHPPAVLASHFHRAVHPTIQLGPAHNCFTWSLSRPVLNQWGRVAAASMLWDTQRWAHFKKHHIALMEDTKEKAVSCVCSIDQMKRVTAARWLWTPKSVEKDVRSSSGH